MKAPRRGWAWVAQGVLALGLILGLLAAGTGLEAGPAAAVRPAVTADQIPFYGVNAYLTALERSDAEVPGLIQALQDLGVVWVREEIPWASIDQYGYGHYDARLKQVYDAGLRIIGILETTAWSASDPSCRAAYPNDWWWCEPVDVSYPNSPWANFVRTTVERYDGDGVNDAPGSPRIDVWEIWNEPDQGCDPAKGMLNWCPKANPNKYGQMLKTAYRVIKEQDPTALVSVGGLYVFDGVGDKNFFLHYKDDPNGKGVYDYHPDIADYYDLFAIHPYMTNVWPDDPSLTTPWYDVSLAGRIQLVRDHAPLVDSQGRAKPIWITELGWPSDGNYGFYDGSQADALLRAFAIAASKGVAHLSWFQLEDKFNGGQGVWSTMTLIRNDGTRRPSFTAYQQWVTWVDGLPFVGFGPVHGGGRWDVAFEDPGRRRVEVLWRSDGGSETVWVPVDTSRYALFWWVDRTGKKTGLAPSGGQVQLALSGSPILLIQEAAPRLSVSPASLLALALPGEGAVLALRIENAGGGDLTWTLSESISWLTPSATSGSAPALVTLTLDPKGVGTYTGTLNVAGSDGRNVSVSVEYRVLSNLHRIYLPTSRRP